MSEPRSERVVTFLTPSEKDKLNKIAGEERRSISFIVRELITSLIESEEEPKS